MFTTVAQGQRQACIQEGVRLADQDLQTRQRRLIEMANSMNVSFFAVNPLGLVAMDRSADAAPLLGAPTVFRATPSPRSPIVPVTAPAFRRTERVRAEWPILQALETRTARVVGRDGQPLAAQASLSVRAGEQGSAPPTLVVDVLLAALAPGEYAIELVVTGAGESKRTYLPFKVVP